MKASELPRDAASVLKLAARSMFDLFSSMSEGMMLVDRAGRVVSGHPRRTMAKGQRPEGNGTHRLSTRWRCSTRDRVVRPPVS